MKGARINTAIILIIAVLLGGFLYFSEVNNEGFLSKFKFKLGLDLQGGTHLVYKADTSALESGDVNGSVEALRDVIERRVNLFGVSEPLVQTEVSGAFSDVGGEHRLIVELPGVTNVDEAVQLIGQTPLLEFKLQREEADQQERISLIQEYQDALTNGTAPENPDSRIFEDPNFYDTGLTGRYLKTSRLGFAQGGGGFGVQTPHIELEFNSEGAELFRQITGDNIGKILAIYLDGAPISTPVINDAIPDGKAVITGTFEPDEARVLVGRLNSGALPVPIELISTQQVGATLGHDALNKGVKAGVIGLTIVALFLIFWYRLPGVLAVIALGVYVVLMLSLFKIFGVTLTAAGIVGFIISIGMAVDANILIFERMKEELSRGKSVDQSIGDGFERAWASIRDANISSILTAIVLFWFGTSLIQGFALTFGIGVILSMFSAVTITRTFLKSIGFSKNDKATLKWFRVKNSTNN